MNALLPLALVALGSHTFAGDFFVDAANGNDANSGTTSADAWRTITHSVTQLGTQPDTLWIFPGVYDAAHGESFPITISGAMTLRSTAGPDVTVLQASGVILESELLNGGGVHGLTLTGGSHGIDLGGGFTCQSLAAEFSDLRIVDCNYGVYVYLDSSICAFTNQDLSFDRVEIIDSQNSGFYYSAGDASDPDLTLRDCTIRGSGSYGIDYDLCCDIVPALTIERCRIEGNGSDGLHAPGFHHFFIPRISDSSISGNGGHGVSWTGPGSGQIEVVRCTIANNSGAGLRASTPTDLSDSILFGNADDLEVLSGGAASATGCLIGDGDFAGTNGNFTADPLFRDASAMDFRLTFGSPAVDAGAVTTELDVTGATRNSDGDLDLVAAPDLGAFELPTLAVSGNIALGSTILFEVNGPPGESSVVWIARGLPSVAPVMTPFGRILTSPTERSPSPVFVHPAGGPALVPFTIPNVSAAAGMNVTFQSLSRSPNAPASAAYGAEAPTFVIAP